MSIAITAGSRGIANVAVITKAVVDAVKRRGAKIQALSKHFLTLRSLSKCNIMLLCKALYQSRKRCIRFEK